MRPPCRAALLAAALVAGAGCGALRPRPSAPAPPAGTAAGPETSVPSAPPVAPTAPAAPSPAAAPPPAPPPSPAGPTTPATAGPVLSASLPPAEVRRLREDAQRRIEDSARLLQQVEGRPLSARDREVLLLARSLVEQAKKALAAEEYERAANLATKAHALAGDLTRAR